jgi:ABC-type glycerol-3-phosphate transport system substrate-binding protein
VKNKFFQLLALSVAFALCMLAGDVRAAAPTGPLIEARKQAEAKGYVFEASHDDIVAKAKKEGHLRVLSTMDADFAQVMIKAFNEKYPFIKVSTADLGSVQDAQRFLLELKAGRGNEWDVDRLYTEFYEDYLPFQKRLDILGMAKHGVLKIPMQLIDPKVRNVVTLGSTMNVVAYNKNLLPYNKVLDRWEDFLKPEFKGRKFAADIRPIPLAVLVPAWGLERCLILPRRSQLRILYGCAVIPGT